MNEIADGFKVVREVDGRLVSVFATNSRLQTTYESGVSVSGSYGPLLFFPNIVHARHFRFHFSSFLRNSTEIWSCTVTGARVCPSVLGGNAMLNFLTVSQFWNGADIHATVDAPPGTWTADTITLIEKVE